MKPKANPIQTLRNLFIKSFREILPSIVLLLTLSASSIAQGFITPVPDFGPLMNQQCYVIKNDGSRVEGQVKTGMLMNGYLKSFTLKMDNGEKVKFKAEEIKECGFKVGALAKIAMLDESTTSIRKMVKTDFAEMFNRDWAIFENANKHNNEKPVLIQLVNPGFDSKLKVYADPGMNAKESGAGFAKSYLVVKAATKETILVKSKSYNKQFGDIFGDSEQLINALPEDKIKWKEFSEHVFVYDQL